MISNQNNHISCSIIIVNYNTSHLIHDLLVSLRQYCTKYYYELIIIDNSSPNDNLNKITEDFPEANVIYNQENEGFGRANNLGIEHAKGQYILLLNSDTLLKNNALDKCIDFMESEFAFDNNIGLMACQLLNADLTHQPSTFGTFKLSKYLISSNILLNMLFKKKNHKIELKSKFVAAVSGAFMLFRKEVFEKVKPFDPDIFMYSEETELCRERVGKYFNIYYWTGASILHLGGASSNNQLQLQELVSYSLTWYKKGWVLYLLYLTILSINLITEIPLIPLMTSPNRKRALDRLKKFPKLYYYLFFDIPRFPRKWGGRKSPLKAF